MINASILDVYSTFLFLSHIEKEYRFDTLKAVIARGRVKNIITVQRIVL